MSVPAKLQKWFEAGLITADQKASILEHEKTHAGNRWRTGVANTGLLSILLGVALIIASNWQHIPWEAKLGTHFLVNLALTGLVWNWWDKPERDTHREMALGALWGLTLTFIALMGQVFQLGGEAYIAIRVWFWLTTPMILLFAQSRAIARIWAVAFVFYVPYDIISWTVDHTKNEMLREAVALTTAVLVPLAAWRIGAIPRIAVNRPTIGRMLRNLGLILSLVTAATAGLSFYTSQSYGNPGIAIALAVFVIAARFILHARETHTEDRVSIDILCLASLFTCIPFIAPVHADLMAAIHFITLCLLVGALYQQQGKSRQVSLAITFITLRLGIAFIELFGTMMMSGFGFILAGIVLMGLVRLGKYLDKVLKARVS